MKNLLIISLIFGCLAANSAMQSDFNSYSSRQPEEGRAWLSDGQEIFVDISGLEQFWSDWSVGLQQAFPLKNIFDGRDGISCLDSLCYNLAGTAESNQTRQDNYIQSALKRFKDPKYRMYFLSIYSPKHATQMVVVPFRDSNQVVVEFYDSNSSGNEVAAAEQAGYRRVIEAVKEAFNGFEVIEKIHSVAHQVGNSCALHANNVVFHRAKGVTFEEYADTHKNKGVLPDIEANEIRKAVVAEGHHRFRYKEAVQKVKCLLGGTISRPIHMRYIEENFYHMDPFSNFDEALVAYVQTQGISESDARERLAAFIQKNPQ